MCCSVLQCYGSLENARVAVWCSVAQCVAVCCSVLQCYGSLENARVAVWCSVLQCVAVCCSVLQCYGSLENARVWLWSRFLHPLFLIICARWSILFSVCGPHFTRSVHESTQQPTAGTLETAHTYMSYITLPREGIRMISV